MLVSGALAVSQESTRVGSWVLLVPVAICEPHSQDLSEAEKKANSSYKSENISSMFLNLVCTRRTEAVGETSSITHAVRVDMFEATAVEALLHISLGALRVVPAHLQQVILLLSVDSQTSAGNRKLYNKYHEQDDHVKEEQDLVMLHCPNEASQSHKEEKDTHTNDASHHLETGDQTKPLSPCCDANHQETDHNIEDVERTQGVLGAGKSSAAHVHQQINTINP